jgi:hypothetical protein
MALWWDVQGGEGLWTAVCLGYEPGAGAVFAISTEVEFLTGYCFRVTVAMAWPAFGT